MVKLAGADRVSSSSARLEELVGENALLQESWLAASSALLALRAEDVGWAPLNRLNDEDGFSLESLHEVAKLADVQATGNPWLKRGLTLRTSNVFGRGFTIEGKVPARAQEILDRPVNRRALFTQEAFTRNERALFTDGTFVMGYRKSTRTFFPISFGEVTDSASNPDLVQDVWFYQRTFVGTDLRTGQPDVEPTVVWYPVFEALDVLGKNRPASIGEHRVDYDVVLVDVKANTKNGSVWGVPDVLPAMPYAWAYAEYLRDGSKLLKALATIAFKVVSKSKGNASTAGVKMAAPNGAGSTAAMTDNTDLVAMPKSGQVDLGDGQPIAGGIASALEVSLIALLSDPGSASGSFGAASTLDGPTANAARARQALWAEFYARIFAVLGASARLAFPKIQEDPIYRTVQTYQIGFAFGALHQDEFRAAVLQATGIPKLHEGVPEPTVFTSAARYSVEAQQQAEVAAELKAESVPSAGNVSGQGVSDGVGVSAGNNDARNMDAGSKSQGE